MIPKRLKNVHFRLCIEMCRFLYNWVRQIYENGCEFPDLLKRTASMSWCADSWANAIHKVKMPTIPLVSTQTVPSFKIPYSGCCCISLIILCIRNKAKCTISPSRVHSRKILSTHCGRSMSIVTLHGVRPVEIWYRRNLVTLNFRTSLIFVVVTTCRICFTFRSDGNSESQTRLNCGFRIIIQNAIWIQQYASVPESPF